MLLRVRSPVGTARITVDASTPGEELARLILDTVPNNEAQPDPSSVTLSNQPGAAGEKVTLAALQGRKVGDMGFRWEQSLGIADKSHGDLLFLAYKTLSSSPPPSAPPPPATSTSGRKTEEPTARPPTTAGTAPSVDLNRVVEQGVDVYWSQQDGKIERKRDAAFCRHGAKGMCDYCMPLEPYDAKYQAENQIKHLSFNAYLRKLLAGRPPSSTNQYPPLTPLDLSVITPCPSGTHPPFPEGICSKCQPSALTLNSQTYRMVDHVEFATPSLIESLLTGWRRTGTQRIGFLIGHYETYEKVPMGVKAVVEAVWEPRQEGEVDGLTVEVPWEDEKTVAKIAALCDKGMVVVGMIYTDLTADPDDITKTLYKRHAHSFTASGLEMITSAQYQIAHPLPTKASSAGYFSSRWVTCCLTGTEDGQVDVIAWQASEQCEALVKANMIEASVDPGTVRVRTPGQGEYIPEVFYSFKNEYGAQVKKPAKPTFPVEYLFVNITHGFPVSPNPLFLSSNFPVENRPGLSDQSLEIVIRRLLEILKGSDLDVTDTGTWPARIKDEVERWLSDWHLVTFLCMHGSFSDHEQKLLCQVATAHRSPEQSPAREHLFASGGWQTLLTLAEATSATMSPPASNSAAEQFADMGLDSSRSSPAVGSGSRTPGAGAGGDAGGPKACPHCTFINEQGATDCDVCGLPL